MAISDAELAGLSDEEREALEEAASDAEVKAEAADHSDDDEQDDAAEAAAEAPVAAETKADAPAAEAAPAEQPAAEAPQPDFTPRYEVPSTEEFDAKITAIEKEEVELRKKLAEGDLTIDEYDAEKTRLGKELRAVERQQHEAEMYAKMNQQVSAQRWQWEQDQFFGQDANAIYKDKILMAALDVAVKDLANDPQNSSKTGAWFLREADKQIRERFQGAKPPAANASVANPRVPDLAKVPKTLGNMPTAEIPDTGGDEFASLDKLSGMELEKKLARMSPEEVDRYLRAAA